VAGDETTISPTSSVLQMTEPSTMRMTAPGRTWPRVGKNQVFFFKPGPVGFFGFLGVFLCICPEERVFRVFSVSRLLLGASRL
jgi:hypothetical protein